MNAKYVTGKEISNGDESTAVVFVKHHSHGATYTSDGNRIMQMLVMFILILENFCTLRKNESMDWLRKYICIAFLNREESNDFIWFDVGFVCSP